MSDLTWLDAASNEWVSSAKTNRSFADRNLAATTIAATRNVLGQHLVHHTTQAGLAKAGGKVTGQAIGEAFAQVPPGQERKSMAAPYRNEQDGWLQPRIAQ